MTRAEKARKDTIFPSKTMKISRGRLSYRLWSLANSRLGVDVDLPAVVEDLTDLTVCLEAPIRALRTLNSMVDSTARLSGPSWEMGTAASPTPTRVSAILTSSLRALFRS